MQIHLPLRVARALLGLAELISHVIEHGTRLYVLACLQALRERGFADEHELATVLRETGPSERL